MPNRLIPVMPLPSLTPAECPILADLIPVMSKPVRLPLFNKTILT